MKIKVITNSKISYEISVKSRDFESIVEKIVNSKYIKLNENVVLLTSSISEIQKIS